MIRVSHLTKTYKVKQKQGLFRHSSHEVHALIDVSFEAQNGKITALLGPNGAGKTSLLKILAGLSQADNGDVHISESLSFLSDGFGLYPRLTGVENIQYFANLYGMSPEAFQRQYHYLTEVLDLSRFVHKQGIHMSLGERMRTAIARSLIHNPQVIILDEPNNGLDVLSLRRLRQFLKQMATEGKCILFSSHQMHEVEQLADNIYILAQGQVQASGNVQQLCQRTNSQDLEQAFIQLAYAKEGMSCVF